MGVTFRFLLEMGNVYDTSVQDAIFLVTLWPWTVLLSLWSDQGDLRYHCWSGVRDQRALLVFLGLKECLALTVKTRLDVESQNPFVLLIRT